MSKPGKSSTRNKGRKRPIHNLTLSPHIVQAAMDVAREHEPDVSGLSALVEKLLAKYVTEDRSIIQPRLDTENLQRVVDKLRRA